MRPALVLADPELMACAPPHDAGGDRDERAGARDRRRSTRRSRTRWRAWRALRAAALLARGRAPSRPTARRSRSARCWRATPSGSTGIAVHHALCQTIVRTAGTPHAETNAVMLPHSARLMAAARPEALAGLAEALGDRIDVARRPAAGTWRGFAWACEQQLRRVAEAVAAHRLLEQHARPPGEAELLAVLRAAL